MNIYPNSVSTEDVQAILEHILSVYPEISYANTYNEQLDKSLQYLNLLPQTHLLDLTGEPLCLVLISTVTDLNDYAGSHWHVDGADDETTVLLYLNGDPNSGGEFVTEDGVFKFGIGTFITLPSNKLHRVQPYNSNIARIALKWKFK